MKLYKNDRSKKKLYISLEILSSEVICSCLGLYTCINHEKIYVKSDFKAVLLKLTASVQSDNSFL